MVAEVPSRQDEHHVGGARRTLGRYRLVAELGRGSTSIVYLAAVDGPAGFNKLFALKVLRRSLAASPPAVAMFLAEARIGAQLNHPNVVATFEVDENEELPFIVMEFLDGESMQRLVASARIAFKPLPLHMHLAVVSETLEGLAHAHAAVGSDGAPLRIVHRDVSPHNVFVTNSGATKLLDFGFAQSIDSPNTMLSSAARVAYLSPEQAGRGPVDARADLFAVGVMAWEAVTRRRFWPEDATQANILAALGARTLPNSRVDALAKSPEAIRAMIKKATAPDPEDRYQTAAAFQADLRRVLSDVTTPRFAPRDLGQRVVALFAADRARLQRALDEQQSLATAAPKAQRSTPGPPMVAPGASDPLPSFPMPPVAAHGWRGRPHAIAIGALVLMFLLGLGSSLLTRSRPSPGAAVVPTGLRDGPTSVRVSTVASEEPSRSRQLDTTPPDAPAVDPEVAPASAQAESASLEPRPRAPSASRPRLLQPAHATTVRVEPMPTNPPAPRSEAPGVTSPGEPPPRGSGATPPAARPPHPIDPLNPYGP